jgi:hypothetical protein
MSFTDLLSGKAGRVYNYQEMGLSWNVVLVSGWSYSGRLDKNSETGYLCDATEKLDPVFFNLSRFRQEA